MPAAARRSRQSTGAGGREGSSEGAAPAERDTAAVDGEKAVVIGRADRVAILGDVILVGQVLHFQRKFAHSDAVDDGGVEQRAKLACASGLSFDRLYNRQSTMMTNGRFDQLGAVSRSPACPKLRRLGIAWS